MNFDTYIWNQIKSYLIDYKLIEIMECLDEYNFLGKLSESFITCYCERVIPLSKYKRHLSSKSHLVVQSSLIKKRVMPTKRPELLYFTFEEL